MARIFTLTRLALSNPIPPLFRQFRVLYRARRDARDLERLSRERLDDMGIAPRTAANRRGRTSPTEMRRM